MIGLSDLKILHKGLILVAVPVFFELMFVSILVVLQLEAERQAEEVTRSKELMTANNSIVGLFWDGTKALVECGMFRSQAAEQKFDTICGQIPEQLLALKELTEDDPRQQANFNSLVPLAARGLEMFQETKKNLAAHGGIREALHQGHFSKELVSLINRLAAQVSVINAEEKKFREQDPDAEGRARRYVVYCLLGGVGFNVVLAVFLVYFFSQGIAGRLGVLADNSFRLSRKESLLTPLGGSDEIGDVDRVFHFMAEELAEASRKERAIVDNALDVICSIDADGKFGRVNPASLKTWGYEPAELIGRPYTEIVLADDLDRSREKFKTIVENKRALTLENRLVRKDGSRADMLWSAYWSETDKSMFCVVHDISERKELDRKKQEFVAMVSHDLRTPLSSIKAFLVSLADGVYAAKPERIPVHAERLESSTDRLINLINSLLEVEKLEAGEIQLYCDNFPLSSVIEQALESVRYVAEKKGVIVTGAETEIGVYADEELLVRVLVNLLGNAIKFSPDGGTVSVGVQAGSQWVELRVTDEGPGIPPEYRDTIFAKFKQVPTAAGRPKTGTGLGLAICSAIVEKHGGTVGVETETGKGSTFWFRIPAAPVAEVG